MPPIVCIVGRPKVGRTTLIEKLIAELKRRNYRVAAIKHDVHGFEIDHPGKDTWRFAQAGSDAAVISSPQKLALIKKTDHDAHLEEISYLLSDEFDIILAEGYRQGNAPKIEVHRKEVPGELLFSDRELLALATDQRLDLAVPQYALDDAAGLVDLIEKRVMSEVEEDEALLLVNGARVPLNPFVKGFITRVVVAMVSALKGVSKADRVTVSVKRKEDAD